MMHKADYDTITILEKCWCKECGWPVIDACCNWDYEKSKGWDWWVYCSNKSCKNHEGEGSFQNDIEWIGYEK